MIAIRSLQHYLYCPHRWGMLYLEEQWAENAFTVLAEQIHERVHSEKTLQRSEKKISYGGLTVYSEALGIYGKTDCLEFVRSSKGVFIPEFDGTYTVNVIEYKPTAPKTPSAADRLQLYAQYRCTKEIFGGDVNAYIYYADIRRREQQVFTEDDAALLNRIIKEINGATEQGIIPLAEYGKKCNGCSLADRCMPRVKSGDVRSAILRENL